MRPEGFEPPTFGSGIRRAAVAPWPLCMAFEKKRKEKEKEKWKKKQEKKERMNKQCFASGI